MKIPGVNVLNLALRVVNPTTVVYYKYLGRTENNVGQYVNTYADPVSIKGSFQPVPKKLYQEYGLSLSKSYFMLYTSTNILDVGRNTSSDYITFAGNRYDCESGNDWFPIDGWDGILCVLNKPSS